MKPTSRGPRTSRRISFAEALNEVYVKGRDSQLDSNFQKAVKRQIKLMSLVVDFTLTPFQCFVIAALADFSQPSVLERVAHKAKVTNLYILTHYQEVLELVMIGAIDFDVDHEDDGDAFSLTERLETSITLNLPFQGLNASDLPIGELMPSLKQWIRMRMKDDLNYDQFIWLVDNLIQRVKQGHGTAADFCQKFDAYSLNTCERIYLLIASVLIVTDPYFCYVTDRHMRDVFKDRNEARRVFNALMAEEGPLAELELIEPYEVDYPDERGIHAFRISRQVIGTLLPGYEIHVDTNDAESDTPMPNDIERRIPRPRGSQFFDVTPYKMIESHQLFFNRDTQNQYNELLNLLENGNFTAIQKRMTAEHMKPGLAILMHGVPGVGKTQACLELAKASHRDVMRVNLSSVRDKFYGEAEKRMRALFNQYQQMVTQAQKENRPIPILLLDECDALLHKRMTQVNHGTEQADNALQNIALQAIADLEGILVATTNLAVNLDDALDRRFLFKMKFDKPNVEVKQLIWKHMLPEISDDDISLLSREFDFTGGQIYNVKRHCIIQKVLHNVMPDITQLQEFCRAEQFNKKESHTAPIGFH